MLDLEDSGLLAAAKSPEALEQVPKVHPQLFRLGSFFASCAAFPPLFPDGACYLLGRSYFPLLQALKISIESGSFLTNWRYLVLVHKLKK